MEMRTNAILKGPIWHETIEKLVGTVFETIWDVYALCITIGMMYDGNIESDSMSPPDYEMDPHEVARTVTGKANNKSLLEFMTQSALVTTKHLDWGEEERLELAFNEEKNREYNPIPFLTKFANFGVTKLAEAVSDLEDVELLEAIMTFLNSTYESGFENIEEPILLEDLEYEE